MRLLQGKEDLSQDVFNDPKGHTINCSRFPTFIRSLKSRSMLIATGDSGRVEDTTGRSPTWSVRPDGKQGLGQSGGHFTRIGPRGPLVPRSRYRSTHTSGSREGAGTGNCRHWRLLRGRRRGTRGPDGRTEGDSVASSSNLFRITGTREEE